MKHEGPHPDEALPEGEEPMEIEELDLVADLILGLQEGRPRVREDSVTPQLWQSIIIAKRKLLDEVFESFKHEPKHD